MNTFAFPSHGTMGEVVEQGMTLRDYFAAKALQGFCANHNADPHEQEHFNNLAIDSYRTADAMLGQRNAAPKLFSERVVLPKVIAERDALIVAFKEVLRISDRKHDAWDDAKALIARIEAKNA